MPPCKPIHTLRVALGKLRDFFVTKTPEVEAKQIEIAFLASTKNLVAGILAALLIFLGIWSIPSREANRGLLPYLLPWLLMLLLMLARGIYLSRAFLRQPLGHDALIHEGRRLATNGAITGLLWGSSSFLIIGAHDSGQATFLVCAIGLVIMGGAGAQAQYGRLVTWFVCATTSMFVIGILAHPMLSPFIATGFILYALVALLFARQQQLSVKEIIELDLENQALLRQTRDSMRALELARSEAENANRAKSRFLAATSHDLRQPMHALSLYVAHLRLCEDRRELLDTLDKADAAMAAMKDLLNAVLDLSRIGLGAVKPEIRCTDLGELLRRVRTQLQPQADAQGLLLRVDGDGAFASTDPVLFERMLRNIVLNAIRYTRAGSVTVRATGRAGRVIVRVADTGIGIPAAERDQVFEEFYQLHNPERDRQKGLGLGLAIVAQLAVLLAHPVSFRSRVGRGTIFRIMLAACAEAPGAAGPAPPADEDFVSACAVLVIDDDPLGLDSMERVLRDFGCEVIGASGGQDALDKLGGDARIPDIILSDYRLKQHETGVEAIGLLRAAIHGEDRPALPIPGLIISGDTSAEELAAVAREGLPMLHKPLAPALLRAQMNALLGAYSRAVRGLPDGEA